MGKKIFISHQKEDKEATQKISEYFKSLDIDVYFDEFDEELQIATIGDNPSAVVAAVKRGINNSAQMICIISKNTLQSKWIPFEIGYAHDKTHLSILTLKGIKNDELPSYVKIAPILRDIEDLNKYLKAKGKSDALDNKDLSDYNNPLHPLRDVMDAVIDE